MEHYSEEDLRELSRRLEQDENRKKMIQKAEERGYEQVMQSGNKNWYSFHKRGRNLNLQIYVDTEEFEISSIKGMITITTGKCGSFMNDKHFNRFEREIRKIVVDLL